MLKVQEFQHNNSGPEDVYLKTIFWNLYGSFREYFLISRKFLIKYFFIQINKRENKQRKQFLKTRSLSIRKYKAYFPSNGPTP